MKEKIAASVSGKSNYLEIKQNIIDLFATGKYSMTELSKQFRIHRKTVSKIIKEHSNKVNK